jgi:hypothetical protein
VYVQVDLTPQPPVVTLEEPDDCTRFHLAVYGGNDAARVYGALIDAAAGRLENDHALITIDSVRRMAKGRVADDWDDRFDGMLGYARSNSWIDDINNAIQAHIEYVGTSREAD